MRRSISALYDAPISPRIILLPQPQELPLLVPVVRQPVGEECVDEIGYLPIDSEGANLLFQVISARYETGSIMLTSNKAFKDWGEIFKDATIASAILDRILHHCEVITIEGKSYRMTQKIKNN